MLLIVELIPICATLDLPWYIDFKSFKHDAALTIRTSYIPYDVIAVTLLHNDVIPWNKDVCEKEPII